MKGIKRTSGGEKAGTKVSKVGSLNHGRKRSIHWKAPTLMLLGLLGGIGIALAQHFFYHHLDGRATDGSETTFSQVVNTGIGTALAFLFKSFVVLATAGAYTQLFWYRLRQQDNRVQEIDSLSMALTNILDVLDPRQWFHHPLLLAVAATAWLLPIAAVIAPTALTTRYSTNMRQTSNMEPIPKPDFARDAYAAFDVNRGAGIEWYGSRPSLNRIVVAVAAQGSVIPAPVTAANSSYTLQFQGPYLACSSPSAVLNQTVSSMIEDLVQSNGGVQIPLYACWRSISYPTDPTTGLRALLNDQPAANVSTDYLGTDPSIYFALVTKSAAAPTVLECTVYNTSYTVEVVNKNGVQTQLVKSRERLNTINILNGDDHDTSLDKQVLWQTIAYETLLTAYYQILIGSLIRAADTDVDVVETLSTMVMSTSLALSNELYSIVAQEDYPAPSIYTFNPASTEPASGQPFQQAVEALFLNITLSLMSSEAFRTNFSSPDADHSLTNVTIFEPYIVYHYTPRNLIAAYASGIGLSVLTVLVGSFVLWSSGKSYTMTFSTVMRTTRNAELGTVISPSEMDGRDPLPEHMTKAKLRLKQMHDAEEKDQVTAATPKGAPKDYLTLPADITGEPRTRLYSVSAINSHTNGTPEHHIESECQT